MTTTRRRWPVFGMALLVAGALMAIVLLVVGPRVLAPTANAERLETDLRALLGDLGSVEIEALSSGRWRSRVTAEGIRVEAETGERLLIERYRVEGDYDRPDEVIIEGLRLEDRRGDADPLSVERIVLGEPSQAVPPLRGRGGSEIRVGSLSAEGLALTLGSALARSHFPGTPLAEGEGRLTVERVRGEALSRDAVGWLELSGLAGVVEQLDDLGRGAFRLARLRVEGLSGLAGEDEERLERLLLEEFEIDTERLVASLESLELDGDLSDGEGGLRLTGLAIDLVRLVELAPAEERLRLHMAGNVLTDREGLLRLDAALLGRWQDEGDHGRLVSDSHVDIQDVLRLAFTADLPLVLPEGLTPEALLADPARLEAATLLGGDLRLTLAERGLFGRLATLGATLSGVSEAQYLEQARLQASGYGMLFGPQVQAILLGLVELLEGSASELEVRVRLPAESRLESYADDPLGLPDRLGLEVETR